MKTQLAYWLINEPIQNLYYLMSSPILGYEHENISNLLFVQTINEYTEKDNGKNCLKFNSYDDIINFLDKTYIVIDNLDGKFFFVYDIWDGTEYILECDVINNRIKYKIYNSHRCFIIDQTITKYLENRILDYKDKINNILNQKFNMI